MCALHAHPERAAELGRKGGRARRYAIDFDQELPTLPPPKSAAEIRDVLGRMIADLYGRRIDPKIANTVAYVANVQLRAFEVADLERRLKMLEDDDHRAFF
jgi:hypothetical protein